MVLGVVQGEHSFPGSTRTRLPVLRAMPDIVTGALGSLDGNKDGEKVAVEAKDSMHKKK